MIVARSLALESAGLRSGDGERSDPGVVVWPGGRGRGPGRDHAAAERHERAGEAGGASVARRSPSLGGAKPKARPAGLLVRAQAGLGDLSLQERFIRFLSMCRMPFPLLQGMAHAWASKQPWPGVPGAQQRLASCP